MKIKILLTFLVLISTPTYSYAAWVCPIKDQSAQALLDYIKDNRQVVKNITNGVIVDINDIKQEDDTISTMFNEMFNFSWYYSYFHYFVTHPISNDVPYQVKRDYELLSRENDWLIEYLKKISSKWNTEVIWDVCKWVIKRKDLCEEKLNNKTSVEIVLILIQNNAKILDLYRLTIIWESQDFNSSQLILVDDNFITELNNNYWKNAVSVCNTDGWFFEQITTKIEWIKLLNKQWADWVTDWKKSWQLLIWNSPDEEAKIEKQEHKKYLSNQWVSTENQEIMNNNLDKYNSEWLSLNNNFLSNTISSTYKKIENELGKWKKEIVWDFFNKKENDVSINDLTDATDNSKISISIKERITAIYENEVPFAAIWDDTTENLRAKIIETHFSLDNSINTLEKTIEISKKVCNSQGWWWNCN